MMPGSLDLLLAEPAELQERLARLGWSVEVTPTAGPFYWGAGARA